MTPDQLQSPFVMISSILGQGYSRQPVRSGTLSKRQIGKLRRLFHPAFFAVFIGPAYQPINAMSSERCMLVPISLQQRADYSVAIIEGKVVGQYSFWDARHLNIYTSNLVEVYKVFKGNITGTQVEIITEGGTVGNQMHVFSSTLRLERDQMGIFFCEPSRILNSGRQTDSNLSFMVYSSLQGFIEYNLYENTAREPFRSYKSIELEVYSAVLQVSGGAYKQIQENKDLKESLRKKLERSMRKPGAVPTITGISPTSISGGTDSVLTITGTNFGSVQGTGFVEFKDADDGGASFIQPLASDYASWTGTEIKVKVPSTSGKKAGTGVISVTNSDPSTATSSDTLTVRFSYTNISSSGTARMPDHIDDDATGGYTFRMESADFASNAGASAAFYRAMDTWACGTEVNWRWGANTAVDVIASDGINIVRFDNGSELSAGVLARMTSYYTGCTSSTWYVTELDVVFDDGTSWQYGPALPSASQYDFESVALHELGHGHQLSHIILPGALMHYAIANGATARTLSANDIAGGDFVMARSLVANPCGPGPMTAGPCPAVPIQLASLSASVIRDTDVEIAWRTVSETNNYGFEIHRKRGEMGDWSKIAFVEGHGTTLTPQSYSHINRSVAFGKYYYRIKQIDLDGTSETFPEMEVNVGVGPDRFVLAQNYPNPFNPTTVIEFVVPHSQYTTLKIFNILGQEVATLFEGLANSDKIYSTTFDASNMGSGVYFYQLRSAGRIETKRMLLMK